MGRPDAIVERIRAHQEAGSVHVAIQPIAGGFAEQVEQLRALAPVLIG